MGTLFDTLFKTKTLDETVDFIACHLPDGRAWDKKYDIESNTYKLIKSLSAAFNAIQNEIEHIATEFNINLTNDLLIDWEKSCGLPDECTQSITDLQERRNEVINRFRKVPIVTLAEMQALVDSLLVYIPGTEWFEYEFEMLFEGIEIADVELIPGADFYTFEYEFEMTFQSGYSERFTLVVKAPTGVDITRVLCVLRKVNPACVIIDVIRT